MVALITELPALPDDIDPDAIPPFSVSSASGATYHYNRPLTPEEREMYNSLKADPSYKNESPAGIKMSAIILVRQKKKEAGALIPIYQAMIDRRITEEEGFLKLDEFYERTR